MKKDRELAFILSQSSFAFYFLIIWIQKYFNLFTRALDGFES